MVSISFLSDISQSGDSLFKVSNVASKVKKKTLVYEHSGEIPDLDPPDSSVAVESASASLINRVITQERRREKFLQFLDDGHEGFIAHDGEDLIARGWVTTPISTSVPYNLPTWVATLDAYWLTHARTREAYRNRGWHKYMIHRRLQWIREREREKPVYTDTAPEKVSRHSFLSTGFDPCGKMTTYRIGHPSLGVKQFGKWNREATHPPMPCNRDT